MVVVVVVRLVVVDEDRGVVVVVVVDEDEGVVVVVVEDEGVVVVDEDEGVVVVDEDEGVVVVVVVEEGVVVDDCTGVVVHTQGVVVHVTGSRTHFISASQRPSKNEIKLKEPEVAAGMLTNSFVESNLSKLPPLNSCIWIESPLEKSSYV